MSTDTEAEARATLRAAWEYARRHGLEDEATYSHAGVGALLAELDRLTPTVTCMICGARHHEDYARDFAGQWGGRSTGGAQEGER